jgi:opacity protein-like surface antigen
MAGFPRFASIQVLLSLAAFEARAEGFVDFYGGLAARRTADVTGREYAPFMRDAAAQRTEQFGSAGSFGARVGGFLPSAPWFGLAADLSFVRAEGDRVNVSAVPLSTLLIFRARPDWRGVRLINPYGAIGPAFVVVPELRIDLRPALAEAVSPSAASGLGVDVRTGLAFRLSPNVALLLEYRFLWFRVDFEQQGCATFGCALFNVILPVPGASEGTRRTAEAGVSSHHLLIGISFR